MTILCLGENVSLAAYLQPLIGLSNIEHVQREQLLPSIIQKLSIYLNTENIIRTRLSNFLNIEERYNVQELKSPY